MASDLQPPNDRKRVKVYELRDNDWFDRGTGFCMGQILDVSFCCRLPGQRKSVAHCRRESCTWPRAEDFHFSMTDMAFTSVG
jgi:hypothetical protein